MPPEPALAGSEEPHGFWWRGVSAAAVAGIGGYAAGLRAGRAVRKGKQGSTLGRSLKFFYIPRGIDD